MHDDDDDEIVFILDVSSGSVSVINCSDSDCEVRDADANES